LDDQQASVVVGSEGGAGERKGNSSHLPDTFKTPKENPAAGQSRLSSLGWLEGQSCRRDPVSLPYTRRQREPLVHLILVLPQLV